MTVIIPAHNEAAVIERCLAALFATARPGELHAWVVANACGDATADVARAFGDDVTVIETNIPSKAHALNLGDEAASGFPRIYVDADVILDTDGLRELGNALGEPGILAASPLATMDFSSCSWPVRAYYAIWLQLPYCRTGISGAGVYALSATGRERFDKFPNVTADDAFVRLQFAPHERKTVDSCRSTVTPPKSLNTVIDIKTRSHFGNEELRRQFPQLWRNEHVRHGRGILTLAANPFNWPHVVVYIYVKLATRLRVRQRFKRGQIHLWERDESSRERMSEMGTP